MKSVFFTIAIFTFITAMSSCGDTKQAAGNSAREKDSATTTLYQNEWKLSELNGKKVPVDSKAMIAFTAGQSNKLNGYTGCNSMMGSFEISNVYGISFSPIAATKMACVSEENNTLEADFLSIFPVVTRWYIYNGNQLTLFSKETKIATFTKQKSVTSEELKLNGEWELNYISGSRIAFDGLFPNKKPTIVFNFPNEEASGSGSCNGYTVKVKTDGSKINFGDALSTLMACEGDGNGELVYFKTLKTITSYNVDDNTLTMIMGDIAVMRFSRK